MIYLVLFLIIVAFGLRNFSLNHVLDDVIYTVKAEKSVVEADEVFTVTSNLHNNKWLPVTFIKIAELIPSMMWVDRKKQQFYEISEKGRILSTTYLMPFQKYSRTFKASMPSRGRFFLHGAILYGGDLFGLSETVEYVNLMEEIVVLPRPISSGKLEAVMGGFLGDFSVNRFIMEDPILTIGFRDYTGREPMKNINWPQSLKANKLMVKNFDHTTDLSVTVILNVENGEDGRTLNSLMTETAFSVARYVCETLEQKKIKYSFITNATAAGAVGHWSSVSEGLGNRHLYTILEGLGRATYDSTMSFDTLLLKASLASERGRAHIVITPSIAKYWQNVYKKLSNSCDGHAVLICTEEFCPKPELEDAI